MTDTPPLPVEGDQSGGNGVSSSAVSPVEHDIKHHRWELWLAIIQRWAFFVLSWSVVLVFYGTLLCLLRHGPPGTDGYKVYLTELSIVALIPTAVLLRLAVMAASKDECKSTEPPLASVEVVREALKAVVELTKGK